jgi:glycerol-3-phosphate acyltransferase PlsX
LVAAAKEVAAEGIAIRAFGDLEQLIGLQGVDGVELIEATQEIGNDEEPVAGVRRKPDSSIVRAAADVAEGNADAIVSAGSTGATLTASMLALRRMSGVRRPALALQLAAPGRTRPPALLLDLGANADARPGDLVQFAFLGSAFSQAVLGIDNPRVALLSIGEEAKKGTPRVIEAHEMLAASEGIEFIGNVEGRDLLGEKADVVVTDGFTGNVALKTIEGTAKTIGEAVRAAARSGPMAMLGGLLLRPALGSLRKVANPDTHGGTIVLGLRKISVVTHGSAGSDGIANSIRVAARAVEGGAVARTAELLERSGATRAAMRETADSATAN